MYTCPHCNKELGEVAIFRGLCPFCKKVFEITDLHVDPSLPIKEQPEQSAKAAFVFLYRGDHGNYTVKFSREGNNLMARCTCPAGNCGMYCKHRLAIIRGETVKILSDNKEEVAEIAELVKGTDVEAALSEVIEAEEVSQSARRKLLSKKRNLAEAMDD